MKKIEENRYVIIGSGIVAVVFIVLWTLMVGSDTQRAWRSLLANYLFFASASGGLVVWPAIVTVCEGEWMGRLERMTRTGLAFSLPSVAVLILLWTGSKNWAPWTLSDEHPVWLNNTFLFSRNLFFLVLFWVMVLLFFRNRHGKNRITVASWLILTYTVTFSFTGFDLVMALNPKWHSMMMGGYFFISGLYMAAVAWAFLSVLSGKPDKNSLVDIGKLIVAFSLLTTYLMFSQLLPIWYENLPDETTFLLPMMNFAWRKISYLVLFLVYLGPLILLMTKRAKSSYPFVGVVTLFLLTGLWIERWWLVYSGFEKQQVLFGWIEITPAVAFLAIILAGLPFALNLPALIEKKSG